MNASRIRRFVFLGSLFALTTCAPTLITSPEDTVTTHVAQSRTPVYAPRAARAQKVVFDTPDKQLIYQPDSPLRQFFDEHAHDFASSESVKLAKATILEDLLARLRNNEAVRGMVTAVIDRHFAAAAKPPDDLTSPDPRKAIVVDAVCEALGDAGYPDMRDDAIDEIFAKMRLVAPPKPSALGESGGGAPPGDAQAQQSEDDFGGGHRLQERRRIWKDTFDIPGRAGAEQRLVDDLTHALRDRSYFRHAISSACEKRSNLFRGAEALLQPLRRAQARARDLLMRTAGERYFAAVEEQKSSLFAAYLAALQRDKLVTATADDNQELIKTLRTAYAKALGAQRTPEQAIDQAWLESLAVLQPTLSGNADEAAAQAAVMREFRQAAIADEGVRDGHGALARVTTELHSATAEWRTKRGETDTHKAGLLRGASEARSSMVRLQQAARTAMSRFDEWSRRPDAVADRGNAGSPIQGDAARYSAARRTVLAHLGEYKGGAGTSPGMDALVIALTADMASVDVVVAADDAVVRNRVLVADKDPALATAANALDDARTRLLATLANAIPGLDDKTKLALIADLKDDQSHQQSTVPAVRQLHTIHGEERTPLDKVTKARTDYEVAKVRETDAAAAKSAVAARFTTAKAGLRAAIDLSVAATNSRLPKPQHQDLVALRAHLTRRLDAELAATQEGTVATLAGLETLATAVFGFAAELDRAPSRRAATSRFVALFGGMFDLISSDRPILGAVLRHPTFPAPDAAARERVAELLTNRFFAEWPAEKRKDNPANLTDSARAADLLVRLLEAPDVPPQLGVGAGSVDSQRAFTEELYQAFKHRLPEVLAAERPAEYDYWWLTFYPKAIPLGDRTLEGQSVVQVDFPARCVDQEQYQRWSADQKGEDSQIAADVLTNFLTVLDTGDLAERHPGVRQTIVYGLGLLGSDPDCSRLVNYLKRAADARLTEEMDRLKEQARTDKVMVNAEEAKRLAPLRELRPTIDRPALSAALEKIDTLTGRSERHLLGDDQRSATAAWQFDEESQQKRSKTPSLVQLRDVDAIEYAVAGHELSTLLRALSLAVTRLADETPRLTRPEAGMADHKPVEDDEAMRSCRAILRRRSFGVEHVLFAVVNAVRMHTPLPGQVALYLYAYFDGTGVADAGSLGASSFVVPYPDREKARMMRRYLIAKGVRPADVRNLEERLLKIAAEKGLPSIGKYLEGVVVGGPSGTNDDLKDLFRGIKYSSGRSPSDLLRHPWLLAQQPAVDISMGRIMTILEDAFTTSYPAAPSIDRLQREVVADEQLLRDLIFRWLRPLAVEIAESGTFDRARIQRFLDSAPFLTADVRQSVLDKLSDSNPKAISKWLEGIYRNGRAMDQLRIGLAPSAMAGLWRALGELCEPQRKPIQKNLAKADYDRFLLWARPQSQPGIQIIDLLPASRDDLVSMSISSGGVIAKLAAQADSTLAYDANRLEMLRRYADQTTRSETKGDQAGTTTSGTGTAEDPTSTTSNAYADRFLHELQDLKTSSRGKQQSLGATAEGSLYGRAKAAMAFARRREYLDAAITAAGRGDNFAKWVVRKSDLRSTAVGTDARRIVAAAHTGFPNGDQPFHLLVRIPHSATHTDWSGRRYILFNSAYAATRHNGMENWLGHLGYLAKGIGYLLHPPAVAAVQDDPIVTVFPFMWDAQNKSQQDSLLETPNRLGGRIILDNTDRVLYSQVERLIDAEAGFIKLTRETQAAELNTTLQDLEAEAAALRQRAREELTKRRDETKPK